MRQRERFSVSLLLSTIWSDPAGMVCCRFSACAKKKLAPIVHVKELVQRADLFVTNITPTITTDD